MVYLYRENIKKIDNLWINAPLVLRDLAETILMILTMEGNPFCYHGSFLSVIVTILDTYTPNSAYPVSPFVTDFYRGTTKNHHPTTIAHQQESVSLSPFSEIAPPFPPHSIHPYYHPKGTWSINRPWTLNGIRASTEIFVKSFFIRFSPLFPQVNLPTTIPQNKGTLQFQ